MALVAAPITSLQVGAGVLMKAPPATTIPAMTVSAVTGKFTDAWPAGWNPVGATETGHEFNYQLSTDRVLVAEYLTAVKIVSTDVAIGVAFAVSEMTAKNYAWVLNGGTYTLVSGTGLGTLSKVSPPVVGQETRTMLGWESDDGTERVVWYQALQGGQITIGRHKGVDNANLPVSFQVEQPTTGNPFDIWVTTATRVGV